MGRKIQNKFYQTLHTAEIVSVKFQENIHLIWNGSLFHFRIIFFLFYIKFFDCHQQKLFDLPPIPINHHAFFAQTPAVLGTFFFHLGTCFFNLTSMEPFSESGFRSFRDAVFVVHGHCCILVQDVSSVESTLVLGEKRPYTLEENLCAHLREGQFLWKGAYVALTREVCFREMLCFREHFCFQPSGNENCHIFMVISFPSLTHFSFHGCIFPLIFPFIGTSSPLFAYLFVKAGGGRRGLGIVCFREIFCEDFAGIRKKTLNKKCPIKFMVRSYTLSFPRFVYADYLRGAIIYLKLPQICLYRLFTRI